MDYLRPVDKRLKGKYDGSEDLSVLGSANANGVTLMELDCRSCKTIQIDVWGTFVGTITVQGSSDAAFTRPYPIAGYSAGGGTSVASTITTQGVYVVPVKCRFMRLRTTAYTSGTINSRASGSSDEGLPYVVGAVTVSGNVSPTPNLSSSANLHALVLSAATTNATSVKGSAGSLMSVSLSNSAASWRYFKLYNKASAPTLGTDTPLGIYGIPPGGSRDIDCGAFGIRLTTGIAYAITGGAAVADATVVAANDVHGHIVYV